MKIKIFFLLLISFFINLNINGKANLNCADAIYMCTYHVDPDDDMLAIETRSAEGEVLWKRADGKPFKGIFVDERKQEFRVGCRYAVLKCDTINDDLAYAQSECDKLYGKLTNIKECHFIS